MFDLGHCYAARDMGYKPYLLAKINNREVECISFPFVSKDGSALHIMVRMVKGDSTSMIEAKIPSEVLDYV